MEHPNLKYIRGRKLPHMFCQGCGCGQILSALLFAIDELKLDTNKMVAIGGVGCSSRIPAYWTCMRFTGFTEGTLRMQLA